MRRYFVIGAIVLFLHVCATLIVRPYANWLVDVGRALGARGNDIADLPTLLAVGWCAVGAALVVAAIAAAFVANYFGNGALSK